jgi:hypothetical protein
MHPSFIYCWHLVVLLFHARITQSLSTF